MTIKFSKEFVVISNLGALNISLKDPIPGKRENKDTTEIYKHIYKVGFSNASANTGM
jgi:hypothetical protein